MSCPFGVSDTAASTGAKVASLTDSNPDFTLVSGREIVVCFTTANSASNPTLNFAGSGAIPIYYPNGQTVGAWPAETWMHLKYFYATVGNSTIQRWILLSPILSDTVAAGNMNLITSNAVFQSINSLTYIKDLINTSYTSFLQIPRGVYSIGNSIYSNYSDKPTNDMGGRIIFIAGATFSGSDEQICLLATSNGGHLYLGYCYGGIPRYDWRQII